MKYNKKYFEPYALLTLIKCFGYNIEDILDQDVECPDWQSDKLDLGIEVTEAKNPMDGQLDFIIDKYFNKGLSGRKIQNAVKKEYPKYGHLFRYKRNISYCTVPISYSDEINKIAKAITEKTEKLNKNYKVFKNNWLYIFAGIELYCEDIPKILSLTKTDEKGIQYDKIFINVIDKILVINRDGFIEEVEVDNKTLKELKAEALKNKKP